MLSLSFLIKNDFIGIFDLLNSDFGNKFFVREICLRSI